MHALSVGQVAGRLGVTPSTVRMWGRRYGLTASERTAGGHRRYTEADLDRLVLMHEEVIAGATPAAAAAGALGEPSVRPRRAGRGGPGGSTLAVPGAGARVRGVARAASRLDAAGVTRLVARELAERGTLATWDQMIRPVMVASGALWERTGSGIEVEHLLTQAVTTALTQRVGALPELAREHPVVLAGAPSEDHVLPVVALRTALAEVGVPALFLGPRSPLSAVATVARRIRAPGVLVWSLLPDADAAQGLALIGAAHRRIRLVVGGPGWLGLPVEPAGACTTLSEAVEVLSRAWHAR